MYCNYVVVVYYVVVLVCTSCMYTHPRLGKVVLVAEPSGGSRVRGALKIIFFDRPFIRNARNVSGSAWVRLALVAEHLWRFAGEGEPRR